MDTTQNQVPQGEKKAVGPAVGIVVIIIVLLLGAWYFWSQKNTSSVTEPTPTQTVETSAAPVSSSDSVDSIQGDLQTSGSSDINLNGLN